MLKKIENLRPVILGIVVGLMIRAFPSAFSISPETDPNLFSLITVLIGMFILAIEFQVVTNSRKVSNQIVEKHIAQGTNT